MQSYLEFEKQSCLLNCPDSMDLTTDEYQLHQRVLAQQCQAFGIHFLDLTPTLKAKETAGDHLYWDFDEHMKGQGYQLVGKKLWENWSSLQQ